MNLRVLFALAALALASVAFAAPDDTALTAPAGPGPADAYLIGYAANITVGDSYVNITNAGTRGGYDATQTGLPGSVNGGICANVYVFDPSEEMVACCSCYVSPDGLRSLSAQNDLVVKTLTPGKPNGIVIKLVATLGDSSSDCDAAAKVLPTTGSTVGSLEAGMRAWGTTLHLNTTTSQSALTENAFQPAQLSASELAKLTTFCAFIKANGSTFGICNSCQLGGLLGGTTR